MIFIIPANQNLKPQKKQNNDLVNNAIPFKELLVIDETGTQLGVLSKDEALKVAQSKYLDLLVVAAQGKPPVAKILDYNKYKFDQSKKEKEIKKNQNVVQLKEIRLSVTIQSHDIETKANMCKKILAEGCKVRVSIMLKSRLAQRPELGKKIMDEFLEYVGTACKIDVPVKQDGKQLFMVLVPNKE